MKKKLLTILLALCLTASLLTGCVGSLGGLPVSESTTNAQPSQASEIPATDAPQLTRRCRQRRPN